MLDTDKPVPEKLINKLEKRVNSYFNHKHQLDDFTLTGLTLVTDINVYDRAKVAAYMKVIQRIGKVNGFSPSQDDRPGNDIDLYLDGNSNGIKFMLYDLERLLKERSN